MSKKRLYQLTFKQVSTTDPSRGSQRNLTVAAASLERATAFAESNRKEAEFISVIELNADFVILD